MRQITELYCNARGLEMHIVDFLSSKRKQVVEAVLQEQDECWDTNEHAEAIPTYLQEESSAYSELSRRFSERMAKCDHIEACIALICRWSGGQAAY